MFPQQVLDDIIRGQAYYSDLNAQYLAKLANGCCGDCYPKDYICLKRILRSLDYKVQLDQYDDVAIKLYEDLLIIIGDYVIRIPPTVNAGPDKTAAEGTTTTFNATITQGSAPIATILWTKLSGGAATLSGITTANLTVSDYVEGEVYTFKIKVTATDGLTDSDTVSLTVTGALIQIRFGVYDTEPDLTTAVYGYSMNIPADSTEYEMQFPDEVLSSDKFIAWDEPVAQPIKTEWESGVLNSGAIPDLAVKAPITVGSRRAYGSRSFFVFNPNGKLKVSADGI